jgi:hypothetical protein
MPNFSCVAQQRRHCVSASLITSRVSIRGLVAGYIVAIYVTRARFQAVVFFERPDFLTITASGIATCASYVVPWHQGKYNTWHNALS